MIIYVLVVLLPVVHSKSGASGAGGARAGTPNSYGYTYTPYAAVGGGMYLSGRWGSRRYDQNYRTSEGDSAIAVVVGNVTYYKQLCECPPDTTLRWYDGWDVGVGRKSKDNSGCGLTPCQDRYGASAKTVFTCYEACLANPQCKAFEYAPRNGDKSHPGMSVCSLHESAVPNEVVTSTNGTRTSVLCQIDRTITTTKPIDSSSTATWDLFMNGNITTIVANMLGSVGDTQKQNRMCGADPPGDALDIERLYSFDSETCASRNCKAIISEPQCKEAAAAITDAVYMEATTLALPDFMNATQPTSCEQDNGCAYLSQSNQVRQCNNYVDKCTKASPCLCWCTIADSSSYSILSKTTIRILSFVFIYYWF